MPYWRTVKHQSVGVRWVLRIGVGYWCCLDFMQTILLWISNRSNNRYWMRYSEDERYTLPPNARTMYNGFSWNRHSHYHVFFTYWPLHNKKCGYDREREGGVSSSYFTPDILITEKWAEKTIITQFISQLSINAERRSKSLNRFSFYNHIKYDVVQSFASPINHQTIITSSNYPSHN